MKYVDQFLQDWISGRIAAAEDLKLRAEACGCQLPEQGLYVVLVRWLGARPEMKQLQQAVKRLRSGAGREQFKPAIIEGELTIALSDLSHSPLTAALSFLSSELNRIFGTDTFSYCIGERVDRANHIHRSYEDAKKILHISNICNFREPHIDFKKLGVFRLLYQLPDQDEIRAYCDPYIVPLLEYEGKHGSQLLETLSIYFKYNRNLKKTSAELFTHYNTVAYRVERACEIVGINSDNGDEMLQLYLAIKLYEMRAT
ncbi:Carbohydrate diacid regulator [compost metagenome]